MSALYHDNIRRTKWRWPKVYGLHEQTAGKSRRVLTLGLEITDCAAKKRWDYGLARFRARRFQVVAIGDENMPQITG